jgi:hypothetical protein
MSRKKPVYFKSDEGRRNMKDVDEWNWIVDKNKMTCSNNHYNVTVKMQEEGEGLKGKLLDMSIELLSEISALKNGEKIIEKVVTNAEKI